MTKLFALALTVFGGCLGCKFQTTQMGRGTRGIGWKTTGELYWVEEAIATHSDAKMHSETEFESQSLESLIHKDEPVPDPGTAVVIPTPPN